MRGVALRCGARPVARRGAARPVRSAWRRPLSTTLGDDDVDPWVWVAPSKKGPRRDRPKRAPSGPAPTAPLGRDDAIALLEEEGAVDVETIALPDDAFCDEMVVASALSSRHLRALADALRFEIKRRGRLPRTDGADDADWVSVDLDAYVVQLLTPEMRETLELEALWDPKRTDPQAPAPEEAPA